MNKKLTGLTMFDLIKGVAIIMVIWVHSNTFKGSNDFLLNNMFRVSLMPAFFIVSGYWLKKRSVSSGIKYSLQYILKPYAITGCTVVVLSAIKKILQGESAVSLSIYHGFAFLLGLTDASGTVLGRFNIGWNGAAWFLFALFWAWTFFFMIINIKNEKIQIAIVTVIATLGFLWSYTDFIAFFDLPQGMVGCGYVYMGYILKKKSVFKKDIPRYVFAVSLVVWIVSAWLGFMDIASLTYKLPFLVYIGGGMGAFVIIYLSLLANQLENKVIEGLSLTGRYTNWIMCIHTVEMLAFPWDKFNDKFDNYSFLIMGETRILQFIVRCILIVSICFLMKKVNMKINGNNKLKK
ncbi:MAG: acyltransferase [Lachnospiraceae bacterium]|nr:acyltransferase [Lachnospiraceae bacterium]